MIYDGIPTDQVETYLHGRAWLVDAHACSTALATLVEDLIATMTPAAPLSHETVDFTPPRHTLRSLNRPSPSPFRGTGRRWTRPLAPPKDRPPSLATDASPHAADGRSTQCE